jgi:hypothetical protein
MAALMPFTLSSAQEASLTPPDAKAGECYARVVLPAQYEEVEEQVMVKEASEKISIVPASYEETEEEIEVVPSTKILEPIPATYKEEVETIEVKPASRVWKTSLKKKALPISPAILTALEANGVNLKSSEPGDCYKEYYVPRKFKVVAEDILIRKEHNATEIVEPEFEMVEQTVIVKPAGKEIVEVPAVYEETEEQVLVEAEKTVWKKGQNPAQKVSGATGEIMCLVKIPARYRTIKKRVLKSPATTKIVEVPAETKVVKVKKLLSDSQVKYSAKPALYETIEKTELESEARFDWVHAQDKVDDEYKYTGHQICLTQEKAKTVEVTKIVVDTPARVEESVVPAVKTAVIVQKLASEAKEVKTPIEAEYKMMKKRKKIAGTQIGWKRILCQTNMNKEVIAKIQDALNDSGYKAGKADGVLGKGTKNALDKFQRDNSLATGGLTYETLDALKVNL